MRGRDNPFNEKNEIQYKLTYPDQNSLPSIIEIRLNDEVICSGPKSSSYGTLIGLEHRYQAASTMSIDPLSFHKEPNINPSNFPTSNYPRYEPIRPSTTKAPETLPQYPPTRRVTTTRMPEIMDRNSISDICGQRGLVPSPFIVGGQIISQGAWPWLVAMYNRTTLQLRCGGNLITSKVVITSAHCLGTINSHIRPEGIWLAVGKHNISDWDEKSFQLLEVDKIYIHPDYQDNGRYDADIAVMIVKGRIM